MADKATIGVPNIFPSFRYEDAPKAIEWLNKAFGFEQQFVVPARTTPSLMRSSASARA